MRTIAIANQSILVSPVDFAAACAALQTQVDRDFNAVWGLAAQLVPTAGPATGEAIYLIDDPTLPGALGYHTLTGGAPTGFVFIKPALDAGDAWQATLSHELLEQLADPWVCLTAVAPWNGRQCALALEVCDPVENDEYTIDGIAVSNFIRPAWFLPGANDPVDFLGRLAAPLSLSPGGYVAFTQNLKSWQQSFAERCPAHQMAALPFGRRHRRFHGRGMHGAAA